MAHPQWEAAIATGTVLTANTYPPYWVSVTERLMRQTTTGTGKQYELDSAQTGEMHPTLDNRDAAFSPVNSGSPYSPQVTAFKPFRIRAQHVPTVQLLTGDQATSGDFDGLAAGTLVTAFGMTSAYDAAAQIVTDGTAFQGTRVMSASILAGATTGSPLLSALQWAIHPGRAHSFQARVRVPNGAVSPTMHAALSWVDANGSPLSTVSGTPTVITGSSSTWIQLTVTGTPPANAGGAAASIVLDALTGAFVVQSDAWQVELAAAPTTWVQPGSWFPIGYGGTERWPQIYDMGGTFGQTQPVVVDAFALLAGVYPQPVFFADVLALNPDFFFPLNEPSGATVFADLTGKHNPAPIVSSPSGPGVITPGSSAQSTTPNGTFLGAPSSTLAIANPNTGNPNVSACSCIQLSAVGIYGPPSGGWTRMIAFNNSGAGGAGAQTGYLWFATNAGWDSIQMFTGVSLGTGVGFTGIDVFIDGMIDTSAYHPVAGSYADGNWHLVFFTLSADGKTFTVYVDGVNVYTNTTATSQLPLRVLSDAIGAINHPGDGQFNGGYNGSAAHVAQFPVVLSSTQISNLYTSWRAAWSPEPSGQRYLRILGWAGYQGAQLIQGGATTDMGPATDIDGKTDALTLLQNVVTTENGVHYVGQNGTIAFEARTKRYNQLVPIYTFGENVAGGEWPYEDVGFDFDVSHVIGQVQITQNSTGQIFIANSPTTIAPNYRPTYQRTINVVNPQECVDAANYLASRYAAPQLRVQKIRLHPAAFPAMWPIALSLSISLRVRVMRRTPGAPLIQFDGFIENVKWGLDWDTYDAYVDLEISPANLQLYWVLSALHTTIHTGVSVGGNSVVLNALPDSASNPAAASFCAGLQMTMEPGTANSETLTVLSVSATSPGYTTFTVTFTSNFAFNHAVNAVVSEQLPTALTGVTDPTTWDLASILGTSTTLAY